MAKLVVVLALALIVFGPQDLPRLSLTLWRTVEDFRRTLEDFGKSLRRELEILEREEAAPPPNA
jgi:Sec-independent protein translocase protein TatA